MIEETCPNRKAHTPDPGNFLAWHDWAEKKIKTHEQVQCPGCKLWAIWVPKKRRERQRS